MKIKENKIIEYFKTLTWNELNEEKTNYWQHGYNFYFMDLYPNFDEKINNLISGDQKDKRIGEDVSKHINNSTKHPTSFEKEKKAIETLDTHLSQKLSEGTP